MKSLPNAKRGNDRMEFAQTTLSWNSTVSPFLQKVLAYTAGAMGPAICLVGLDCCFANSWESKRGWFCSSEKCPGNILSAAYDLAWVHSALPRRPALSNCAKCTMLLRPLRSPVRCTLNDSISYVKSIVADNILVNRLPIPNESGSVANHRFPLVPSFVFGII